MKPMNKSINNRGVVSRFKLRNYLWLLMCLVTNISYGKNLGTYGAVFPIGERDIREFIEMRLKEMERNGEMGKLKERFIKNVKAHVLRPITVAGLTTTDRPRQFYYDPTYVVTENITDDKGRIIVKRGTTINPLDTVSLHGVLFFLDADDGRQVKWALQQVKKYDYVKYVLVRGNIKEAGRLLQDRIYFDQDGYLSNKLGIRHVPSIVKQDGKRLLIEEYALKPEANAGKKMGIDITSKVPNLPEEGADVK